MERVLKRGVAGYPRIRGSGKPKVWSEGKTFPFPILSKGDWDKSQGFEKDNEFNRKCLTNWISESSTASLGQRRIPRRIFPASFSLIQQSSFCGQEKTKRSRIITIMS